MRIRNTLLKPGALSLGPGVSSWGGGCWHREQLWPPALRQKHGAVSRERQLGQEGPWAQIRFSEGSGCFLTQENSYFCNSWKKNMLCLNS